MTFNFAHATHSDWRIALGKCWPQIQEQIDASSTSPTLGWCYFTDHYTADAGAILDALCQRWPKVQWVGTIAVGVAAGPVEYIDEPAIVMMLCDLPSESFRLFSGTDPRQSDSADFEAFTALVHADGGTPNLAAQIKDLSGKTTTGFLFGGLSSGRTQMLHFSGEMHVAGLSGVAFSPEVPMLSRVTQGCQPIGPPRTVTRSEENYLVSLDDARALDCAMSDLGLSEDISDDDLRQELAETLVGIIATGEDVPKQAGQFGTDTEVRHLMGVGRSSGLLAVAEKLIPGMRLAFCTRNVEAAKRDVLRIIDEIHAECRNGQRMSGALYISCSGRGGPHFGEPHAEFQLVSQSLGDVPLIGFFAGGEIARHHLYGYTGVLTVFTESA